MTTQRWFWGLFRGEEKKTSPCRDCGAPLEFGRFLCRSCWQIYHVLKKLEEKAEEL